jgi:hypothetical protein
MYTHEVKYLYMFYVNVGFENSAWLSNSIAECERRVPTIRPLLHCSSGGGHTVKQKKTDTCLHIV